jgi:hypothetical protein
LPDEWLKLGRDFSSRATQKRNKRKVNDWHRKKTMQKTVNFVSISSENFIFRQTTFAEETHKKKI